MTFGGMAVVTGLTLLPVGLGTDLEGMAIAGGITLGAGAVLTALGVLGILEGRAAIQPGTGVQFPLAQ